MNLERLRGRVTSNVSQSVMSRWNAELKAAEESENTISIYEPIGADWWTGEGMTAKRMSGILRAIGNDKDVTVNINSPGGDVFEGLAIYNLLKEHQGKVTVKVIGLAASAASFIAMAADEVRMAKASFLMIHNAWVVAAGDRNDLTETAEWLQQFDDVIASIYEDKTNISRQDLMTMMDAETWLGGEAAVEQGFADSLTDEEVEKEPAKAKNNTLYKLDAALAQAGMPRSERRKLLKDIMPGADDAMLRASEEETCLYAGLTVNM